MPVFDAKGFQQNHADVAYFDFEHIDPFTGNVILTFNDLTLPGNAGMDLKWQRVYNSKGRDWIFGFPGVPVSIERAEVQTPVVPLWDAPPRYVTADRAKHAAFYPPSPYGDGRYVALSKEFWRYDRRTHIVS